MRLLSLFIFTTHLFLQNFPRDLNFEFSIHHFNSNKTYQENIQKVALNQRLREAKYKGIEILHFITMVLLSVVNGLGSTDRRTTPS